jgi:hypothetical protein
MVPSLDCRSPVFWMMIELWCVEVNDLVLKLGIIYLFDCRVGLVVSFEILTMIGHCFVARILVGIEAGVLAIFVLELMIGGEKKWAVEFFLIHVCVNFG